MNGFPQMSPTFHVCSATIAAHRGQSGVRDFSQKRLKMAERMGFEPTIRFPLYALSRGDLRFWQALCRNALRVSRRAIPQFSPDFEIYTTVRRVVPRPTQSLFRAMSEEGL